MPPSPMRSRISYRLSAPTSGRSISSRSLVSAASDSRSLLRMPCSARSAAGAELARVLHDERSALRPVPSEVTVRFLTVVEHDEQACPRGIEPPEARVGVPHPRLIAVLHERLHEHARCEEVSDARADDTPREVAGV